ncbi:type VII secretion protein EccB [Mycobacterium vulneris]|uniref:Type VII secretion protein EccB n=2 Tax=Mycolicibacterium TaxID=1866885 RepID=A0A7X6MVV7_9MYCO|nr:MULTISPECIES: type VII secretion protein EccB [Mycolicibacterium]MBX8687836.1 type VII secretion protein EccB [Mycobacterium sp. 20091114027_K0903767]MCP3810740.1 type VII secretion protein EccB [Mycobacteriaceae bacterium Msp059]OCB51471.1 type VII secretion protein EccB [Mycolicibacterium vulneris]NKZ15001.1 type VII secretion protein EccB [Mycolicibacterium septicum DSM 44393]OBK03556.1 type VII secretion protein EccB [Mycolicibacterium fortuitum]
MPVNLASKAQASAYWFLRRRLAHGLLRRSVAMDVEWERNPKLAVWTSLAVAVVLAVGFTVVGWWRPDGQVGQTKVVADSRHAIYVNLGDGRLYPALNLVSAQLIAGSPDQAATVGDGEIAKMPKGPTVGIAGAPVATPVALSPETSRWAVCDSASPTLAGLPVVTGINGVLTPGGSAVDLDSGHAVLMSFENQSYVVTGGVRMPIDLSDRAVAGPLGIEPGRPVVQMSRALYDAIPAGGRLVVPVVPDAGAPAPVNLGLPLVNGAVVVTRDMATSKDHFYVVTGDGVQAISPVVAEMLRQRDTFGMATAPRVAPDRLAKVPTRHVLDVDFYPESPLQIVDSRDLTVTCSAWERGIDDRQGRLKLLASRILPVTVEQARAATPLVGGGNRGVQADQVVFSAEPATFVSTTGSAPDSPARQTLWLLDVTGIRYGVPFGDNNGMQGLGLKLQQARLAPWSMLQVWPAGPELSRAAALTAHGAAPGAAVALPGSAGQAGG